VSGDKSDPGMKIFVVVVVKTLFFDCESFLARRNIRLVLPPAPTRLITPFLLNCNALISEFFILICLLINCIKYFFKG